MTRLNIVTAYDTAFATVGDLAARSIGQYASSIGQDARAFPMPPSDRPPAWGKIAVLYHILQDGDHDLVMWVDADACFVRTDRNILDEIQPDKDLHLVNHRVPFGDTEFHGVHVMVDRPNTGVMVLRKCDWSLRFLEAAWDKAEYLNHPWWDNAAIMDLLGYRCELTQTLGANAPQPEWYDRTGFLPLEWNACPSSPMGWTEVFDPVIVHAAGMPLEDRVRTLTRWSVGTHRALCGGPTSCDA